MITTKTVEILERKNNISISEITLGADVEFELVDWYRIIEAKYHIEDEDYREDIGLDGAKCQVEFRPSYSFNPSGLIYNFYRLLKKFTKKYPGFLISSKGDKYPLGGHIHIGSINPVIIDVIQSNKEAIVEAIDDFVGFLVSLSGAARGSYKTRRAYRRQDWGFEYRTLPSAVFAVPRLLYITLKLIQRLTFDILRNGGIEYEFDSERRIATEKSYKNYLTESEYKYLFDIKDIRHNVLANYKLKPGGSISIKFADDWSSESKIWDSILREKLNELVKRYPVNLRITLFGFREDRGLVSTIEVPELGITKLKDFEPVYYDHGLYFRFGIPRSFRVLNSEDINSDYIEKVKIFANYIAKFITYKLRSCKKNEKRIF